MILVTGNQLVNCFMKSPPNTANCKEAHEKTLDATCYS